MEPVSSIPRHLLYRAIIISALGYFIDVFDIQLFAILRVSSLTDMGVSKEDLATVGGYILNAQFLGMLLGGFLWGFLGDRFGRLKALYGSILIYSLGTFACSFAHDPVTYGVLRFITGFGLAGETGAAITLVAELMPRDKRGWGVAIIAGFGFLGPVSAVWASWYLTWHQLYIMAGMMGLGLLVLRGRLTESNLFLKTQITGISLGSLRHLIKPPSRNIFLLCLLIGFSCVYPWSLLNFFSKEIGHAVLGDSVAFDPKICLLLFFLGASVGDFLSGVLSQLFRSRKKVLLGFFIFSACVSLPYLMVGHSFGLLPLHLYIIYFLIGLGAGNWVLMGTVAAEHFGTNIRATTAITVTNIARGFTIPMFFAFQGLREVFGITNAAAIIGATLYLVAILAISQLNETHGLDLDYPEGRA